MSGSALHQQLRRLGIILLLGASLTATGQQVLLDKPVRGGELTLFPDVNNPDVYYYVSDKPRLATDVNGRPQFSFLRYKDNKRPTADQPERREAEGGGILHALVVLGVTQEQIRDAQRDLQRIRSGARIQGPVLYKSGKLGLVSSFKDPDGNLTTKVVGLGNAPILDGEKAAVSLLLTKQGAKILSESFETPTPDISFSFEMELDGYRSPHRALIKADFEQIYEHQAFGAGVASTYLAAEIKAAFDDLVRKGAITVTTVGSDEKLEALLTTAYNKITEIMFNPLGGTGTPSLAGLAEGVAGQPSLLDRASTLLNQSRQDARAENERIRADNREAAARAERTRSGNAASGGASANPARSSGDTNTVAEVGPGSAGSSPPILPAEHARTARPQDAPASSQPRSEVSVPSFAIVATYEMKRVRQRGTFEIDLNKFTTDKITLRFDENIGDLRSLRGDNRHFRDVDLDDPLFRQREIRVLVDGLNATDFGQYVNFVNVQLRKRHANRDVTQDEVRIDRLNFNREGNNFQLLYGWKGDTDRERWKEFEYRALWSFFGGRTVEQPWTPTSFDSITATPPYQKRELQIEGDPTALAEAQVRLITVKLYYELAGQEASKQVTLNVMKNQLSARLEFLSPADRTDYSYETLWRFPGDRTVSSGRRPGVGDTLLLDRAPN